MSKKTNKCSDKCIWGKLEYESIDGKLPSTCKCCEWEYWGSEGSGGPLNGISWKHRYLGTKKDFKLPAGRYN